ncbi:MAG: D-alanine--D-alanine ligase, partial [Candidatus Levybacteria bacterium]|nr:D-alanine--D-alanine ligase [Candidatus Levybacteria bacterium]
VLHGPFGEDGTVQGMLKLLGIPFVGPGVLGSAVGMDKDVAKRLLRDAKISVVPFLVFQVTEKNKISYESIVKELGLPFFIKPANLGSSIGVSKVQVEKEFQSAIDEAFKYDRKILIEKGIDAREIECAVLGNEEMKASVLGEIIPHCEFYDYDAKYIDEDGAGLQIPAKLAEDQSRLIQELAIKTCRVLEIEGMARVDLFVDKGTSEIYVNEVNTIPGFTSISMYPKLWQESGVSYQELIDQLILLAIARQSRENSLRTTR